MFGEISNVEASATPSTIFTRVEPEIFRRSNGGATKFSFRFMDRFESIEFASQLLTIIDVDALIQASASVYLPSLNYRFINKNASDVE